MKNVLSRLSDWSLCVCRNRELKGKTVPTTIGAVKNAGFPVIPACVPGNIELDMIKAGLIDFDPYFGENTLRMQEYEDRHAFYYTVFDKPSLPCSLYFEGIDTVAGIYLNGVLLREVDNMYLSYELPLDDLKETGNELVVHIRPAMLEARKYPLPMACNAMEYGYGSLAIRKAAHMYGWDVMPRIVSAGIHKPVSLIERKDDSIRDVYLYTLGIDTEKRTARLAAFFEVDLSGDIAQEYRLTVDGACGDSRFHGEKTLFSTNERLSFDVTDAAFWWPRYAGKQNLYDVTVTLWHGDKAVDIHTMKTGIRTVSLSRTDTTDVEGHGDFCFIVNGRRTFAMGSNWVPLDPFHSQDASRLHKAFELLYDVGSNVVRCWGGNVYESDEFFDLCDQYGIMVWQDFAMGCAVYPPEEPFIGKLTEEVIFTIRRLRNHPALMLWAGDNEGDYAYMSWSGMTRNPDHNLITRRVLPELCEAHDYTRPYLPSSPYITAKTMKSGKATSEDHLWGPRDYFKGDFYRNTVCHFASETGYHACPSPRSVARFIPKDELWPWFGEDGKARQSWLVHAACMERGADVAFAYRIKLMSDQVVTLFGSLPDNLDDFARQSQISQAEAKKYFIERFRLTKWRRSGIIWWNIVDGWPQFSDAIVDYYYVKKLAYHFVKRSQAPVCLMFDEPQDGAIALYAVNDTSENRHFTYTVTNLSTGKVVLKGASTAFNNESVKIDAHPIADGEQCFYLIEWTLDGETDVHKNHYFTNILNIDYNAYMQALRTAGFDEFEGFGEN